MGDAGGTSYLYAQEKHVCEWLQGKGDVTLHVVGTIYKCWTMLEIVC